MTSKQSARKIRRQAICNIFHMALDNLFAVAVAGGLFAGFIFAIMYAIITEI